MSCPREVDVGAYVLGALEPEERAKVPNAPGSLDEALTNLEKDHEFLLHGDGFTRDSLLGPGAGPFPERPCSADPLGVRVDRHRPPAHEPAERHPGGPRE